MAPVAKFLEPDFTLSEDSTRTVKLDVASAIPGVPVPSAAGTTATKADGTAHEYAGMISVRVSNRRLCSLTVPIPLLMQQRLNLQLTASRTVESKAFSRRRITAGMDHELCQHRCVGNQPIRTPWGAPRITADLIQRDAETRASAILG